MLSTSFAHSAALRVFSPLSVSFISPPSPLAAGLLSPAYGEANNAAAFACKWLKAKVKALGINFGSRLFLSFFFVLFFFFLVTSYRFSRRNLTNEFSPTRESAGGLLTGLVDEKDDGRASSISTAVNEKFSADKTRYAFEASDDCTGVVQGRACRRHCSRLLYIAPFDIKREDLARTVPPHAQYIVLFQFSHPSPDGRQCHLFNWPLWNELDVL